MNQTLPKMNEKSSNDLAKLVVNQCESNQNLQNVNSETLSHILQNVKAKEKQLWCENNQVDDPNFCEIIEIPQDVNQQNKIQNLPDVKTLNEILHNASSSSMQNVKEIESIWENAMSEVKNVEEEVIDLVSDDDCLEQEPGVPNEVKCEHCETMFLTKIELRRHVEDMIDPELIFKCNKKDCPFETNLMCAWHRHFHSHVKLLCDLCEVAFSSHTELDGHRKSQHEIENDQDETIHHKCESCLQEFNSLESKESHTCRKCHQCNYCESMFISREEVNIHMKNEHDHVKERKRKSLLLKCLILNPTEKSFCPEVVNKPKIHKMKLNLSFAKKIAENKDLQSCHTYETDEESDI